MNVCIVIAMICPGYLSAQFDPGAGPTNLVYWQGTVARGIPFIGYSVKSLDDGSGELLMPDGRKFSFGREPVSIDCKTPPCDKCEPVS